MSSAFAGPSAYPGALGQLRSAPRLTYAAASRLRREQQWRESAVRTLDRIAVLGGPSDEHASSVVGHEGCVKCVRSRRRGPAAADTPCSALAWSDDGTLLASGSDDRRICLWKLGSDGVHQVDAAASGRAASGRSFSLRDEERGWPDPGVGLATVVETGHRANSACREIETRLGADTFEQSSLSSLRRTARRASSPLLATRRCASLTCRSAARSSTLASRRRAATTSSQSVAAHAHECSSATPHGSSASASR
jgi:hypothetical protein